MCYHFVTIYYIRVYFSSYQLYQIHFNMSREKYKDVENYCEGKKSCKGSREWEWGRESGGLGKERDGI